MNLWYTYYTVVRITSTRFGYSLVWLLVICSILFGTIGDDKIRRSESSAFEIAPRQVLSDQISELKQPEDIHILMQQALSSKIAVEREEAKRKLLEIFYDPKQTLETRLVAGEICILDSSVRWDGLPSFHETVKLVRSEGIQAIMELTEKKRKEHDEADRLMFRKLKMPAMSWDSSNNVAYVREIRFQLLRWAIIGFIQHSELDKLQEFLRDYALKSPPEDMSHGLFDYGNEDGFRYFELCLFGNTPIEFSERGVDWFANYSRSTIAQLRDVLKLAQDLGGGFLSKDRLADYIQQSLQKARLLEYEWTLIAKIEGSNRIIEAIFWLLRQNKQELSFLDYASLQDNLYIRQADRRLFLRKEYQPENDHTDAIPFAQHPDRNNPYRELLGATIGRMIGANTAETLVPSDSDILSAFSVTTDPISLPQQTKKGAESAGLVFNVLIRKWDDSKWMIQRSTVADTFVMFDHDQGFNPFYKSLKRYLEVVQWFSQDEQRVPSWSAEDFDHEVVFQVIQRVKELDIDQLLNSLPETIAPNLTRGKLGSFLQVNQRTIEEDVSSVYTALTGAKLERPNSSRGHPSSQQETAGEKMFLRNL